MFNESGAGAPPEATSQQGEGIEALRRVLVDLAASDVRYCHWKSNIRARESLRGETDLDLLVDRRDSSRFLEIAGRHGLKPMNPPLGGDQPGMSNLLGFDGPSGELFHLHVHYQLVIGQRGVKNYRLPVEAEFLSSTREIDCLRVPTADVDLAMLSVRALLKYRYRDAVKDLLGIRHPGIPTEIREEIDWLLDQTTTPSAAKALPCVPPDLVERFLDRLGEDPRAGFLTMKRRLRRELREHARLSPPRARMLAARELWVRRNRFRRRPLDTAMTMPTGGLSIAFVGADGAGKTTAAADVTSWLGWKLSVRRYYLGSKEPSRLSRWSYIGFRAFRRSHRSLRRSEGPAGRALEAVRDGLLGLHYVAIAGDRVKRYRRSLADVSDGRIVVFDRFPLVAASSAHHHRLLDGPQLRDKLGARLRGPARVMAAWEERRYGEYDPPDLLIVMDVDPTVSVSRKPDHSADVLAEKRRGAAELADVVEAREDKVEVVRVDANQPWEQVRRQIRQAVWDAL